MVASRPSTTTKKDLTEEEVESIITQGEDIGTRVCVMLGGEPFVWRPLLDVAERHPQSVFMVFTNGTMINDRVADRIVEVGNVCPMISIEGGRESTDARRGAGTFDRIMAAMDRLRERGAMFAFSCTATSKNIADITSDEFASHDGREGRLLRLVLPVHAGRARPDLSLMPSAEQRVAAPQGRHAHARHPPALGGGLLGRRPAHRRLPVRRAQVHPHQQQGRRGALHLRPLRHRQHQGQVADRLSCAPTSSKICAGWRPTARTCCCRAPSSTIRA